MGAYLGAGPSPKMVSSIDKHSMEDSADEAEPAKLDVMHVSHKGASGGGEPMQASQPRCACWLPGQSRLALGSCPCPRAWICCHFELQPKVEQTCPRVFMHPLRKVPCWSSDAHMIF